MRRHGPFPASTLGRRVTNAEAPVSAPAVARARRRVPILTGALAGATVVAAGIVLPGGGTAEGPVPWWLVAVLLVGADAVAFRFSVFGTPHVVSFGAVPMVLGVALLSPIGFVAARVLGSTATAAMEQRSPGKAAFNISLAGFEAVIVAGIHGALLGDGDPFSAAGVAAAAVAVMAATVVASMVVTAAVAEGSSEVPPGFRRMLVIGHGANFAAVIGGAGLVAAFGLGDAVGAGFLLAAAVVLVEIRLLRDRVET